MWPFTKPKPTPPGVVILDRLGREIDRVEGVWDLANADLRGRRWMHAELSGLSLYGAQCDGINLFGARLHRTNFQKASLRDAELAFSYAAGANFRGSDMRGCSLYRAEIGLCRSHASADFTEALVNETTDIPGRKVLGTKRVNS